MDGKLGLVGAQTAVTAQIMGLLSVEMPERGAVDKLKQLCGLRLGATTAWRNRQRLGARVRPWIEEQTHKWLAPVGPDWSGPPVEAPAAQLIVREADGVMVRFVDGWHEVKVGQSHGLGEVEVKKAKRSARKKKPTRERKRIIEAQYCALRGEAHTLGRQLQALSLSQGLRSAPASQFLSDGGGWMEGLATRILSWSHWTLDYYHASEQVAAALRMLYGVGSEKTRSEHARLGRRLLKDDGNAAVRRSLRSRMRRENPGPERDRVGNNVIRYLERHEARMDYAELKRKSWPIGSGAIEGGGCKLYIQQRFKRPGARWSTEGFANLESLRRLAYNQQWDNLAPLLYSNN